MRVSPPKKASMFFPFVNTLEKLPKLKERTSILQLYLTPFLDHDEERKTGRKRGKEKMTESSVVPEH